MRLVSCLLNLPRGGSVKFAKRSADEPGDAKVECRNPAYPMMSAFEENELLDLMSDVELLLKYRNYSEASTRLQQIMEEHPDYLPAKEALQEVYRMTGQAQASSGSGEGSPGPFGRAGQDSALACGQGRVLEDRAPPVCGKSGRTHPCHLSRAKPGRDLSDDRGRDAESAESRPLSAGFCRRCTPRVGRPGVMCQGRRFLP